MIAEIASIARTAPAMIPNTFSPLLSFLLIFLGHHFCPQFIKFCCDRNFIQHQFVQRDFKQFRQQDQLVQIRCGVTRFPHLKILVMYECLRLLASALISLFLLNFADEAVVDVNVLLTHTVHDG